MSLEELSLTQRIAQDRESMKDCTPVKASPFEKIGSKKISPDKLHANPDDEFTDPNIGPNDSIVSNYSSIARKNYYLKLPVYDEPIIVSKLKGGDYLILNGHHRWAGAIEAHIPKVRVQITDY